MTLRVMIEMLKHGQGGDKNLLARLDICNTEDHAKHPTVSNYNVTALVEDKSVLFKVKNHRREDGAYVLTKRVLDAFKRATKRQSDEEAKSSVALPFV